MTFTRKQKAILEFIQDFCTKNGISPTLEEISEEFSVSKVTIFEHLTALEKKGAIRRSKHLSRSVEIIAPDYQARSLTRFPILGTIAAGKPREAVVTGEHIDLVDMFASRKECFVLKVRGDSMVDDNIGEGDYVFVERRETAVDGEIVVALVDGSETTLKRFYKDKKKKQIRLEPANSKLKTIYPKDVKIQGVVIGVLRKY